MIRSHPLKLSHLALAHQLWKSHLSLGDVAVDATCGNGNDTLVLAHLVLTQNSGELYGFDIQRQALLKTEERLKKSLIPLHRCHFFCQSHAQFPAECAGARLFVYNLGYLPSGEKSLTTLSSTTLLSLRSALSLMAQDGMISITCYPGHEEGLREQEAILNFLGLNFLGLNFLRTPENYTIDHYQSLRPLAPSLIIIKKNHLP